MKASVKVWALALLLAGPVAMAAPTDSIEVVETKYKNLFVFKVHRSLLGAMVEVYHSSGERVVTEVLTHRKMVIDFCDVKFGSYTVKVTGKDFTKSFQYEKRLIVSEVIR